MPKKSPAVQRMTRAIHLAEMDPNNFKPIITGSIYVTFEEKDANAISIASLAKEVANTAETFVICDGAGYEVLDHEGTRGKLKLTCQMLCLRSVHPIWSGLYFIQLEGRGRKPESVYGLKCACLGYFNC